MPTKRPVIAYVPPNLSGGVRVVLELMSRLAQRGWDTQCWWPGPVPTWFKSRPFTWRQFASLDELGNVARSTRAIKMATWWETAEWASQTVKEDDVGLYLVQDDERNYGTTTASNHRILKTYNLVLKPITVSQWVSNWLKSELELQSSYIGCGIDHDVFRPLPILRDRLRVFCPYRPMAGPNDLKGWATARETILKVRAKNSKASIVTFGSLDGPHDLPKDVPHIHCKAPNDSKMRELYCQAGCFLMPSKHEGLCLTALEAMACRCPVVATNADGNMEYSRHGETVLIGSTPDELASHVLDLIDSPSVADALGKRGEIEAAKYQWNPVVDRFEQLLESL